MKAELATLTAAAVAAAAVAVVPSWSKEPVRLRMDALFPAGSASRRRRGRARRGPSPRIAAATAGTAVAWLVGGAAGLLLGVLAGVALDRLVRGLPARAERDRAHAVAADLPLALDLVAACLAAGSPLGPAVEVVGTALGGPLGSELTAVAVALRLGSSAEQAWSRLAGDPVARPVARAVVRVSDSGAALATMMTRLAGEQRDRTRLAADAAAKRAGVLVVAPLGLCFLPAFLLLGVAPVILGLASVVLG